MFCEGHADCRLQTLRSEMLAYLGEPQIKTSLTCSLASNSPSASIFILDEPSNRYHTLDSAKCGLWVVYEYFIVQLHIIMRYDYFSSYFRPTTFAILISSSVDVHS